MPAIELRATNWAGNVSFSATRTHQPSSIDELRRIVAKSVKVHAVGAGHSFSPVADTEGDLVRLDALPATVVIDPADFTVVVPAGMRYAQLAVILQRAGFALANLAALPDLTVAGACATGTHGSGDALRNLAAAVTGLQIIGPDGDLAELSRDANPESFPGAVVAFGSLGVVTRLTLAIEPTFDVEQWVRIDVPLDEIADRFDDVFGAAYSVSAFTDWRATASVWLKRRTDQPESGWAGGRPARVRLNPVPGVCADTCTEQLGISGPWHERLPHFRPNLQSRAGEELQSEFFLARQEAPKAISKLRDLAGHLAPFLEISEIRTVRGDDLWLSPAYGRDSVTFHFTWVSDAAALEAPLAAVQEQLMQLGARPHWGKLTTADATQIITSYERRDDFRQLMCARDPDRKFSNAFADQFLLAR